MPFSPTYFAVTGRAATALYALFKHLSLEASGEKLSLLAPANVCYAALYPALYAGWSLVFCDVNPRDGNVTFDIVNEALEHHKPNAILVPHMYGEPVKEFELIADACKKQGVILIEDAASAMGATPSYPLGVLGDYCIYSTGYAKTVEVGFGGILSSEHDLLDWFPDAIRDLPLLSEKIDQTETLFSRLYRVLRNNADGSLDVQVYKALISGSRDAFLHDISSEQKDQVLRAVTNLDAIVAQRRDILQACEKSLEAAGLFDEPVFDGLYPYSEGSVPWRLSFFVKPQYHRGFIAACLKHGLPVSDWYPCVTPMFGTYNRFDGAAFMEQRIVNFPLTQNTVDHICPVLPSVMREVLKEETN